MHASPAPARRPASPRPSWARAAALALLAGAALAHAASAAEDADPAAPAASGWLAALDIHALTSGRMGAWVARLAEDERLHARLAVARGSSGVDLLRDLSLACAAGADADPAGALARVTGRFERERVETLVLAAPGGSIAAIGPGRLMTVPRAAGGSGLYAILDEAATDLLAGSDRARVLAAVAAPPQVDVTRFGAVLEHDASATPLLWAGVARIALWKCLPAQAEPARAVEAAQLLIEERGGMLRVRSALVASSATVAAKYASIVGGLCELAAMEPHVRLDSALEALLASRTLALHGRRIDLSAEVAIDLAERAWTPRILAAAR